MHERSPSIGCRGVQTATLPFGVSFAYVAPCAVAPAQTTPSNVLAGPPSAIEHAPVLPGVTNRTAEPSATPALLSTATMATTPATAIRRVTRTVRHRIRVECAVPAAERPRTRR